MSLSLLVELTFSMVTIKVDNIVTYYLKCNWYSIYYGFCYGREFLLMSRQESTHLSSQMRTRRVLLTREECVPGA